MKKQANNFTCISTKENIDPSHLNQASQRSKLSDNHFSADTQLENTLVVEYCNELNQTGSLVFEERTYEINESFFSGTEDNLVPVDLSDPSVYVCGSTKTFQRFPENSSAKSVENNAGYSLTLNEFCEKVHKKELNLSITHLQKKILSPAQFPWLSQKQRKFFVEIKKIDSKEVNVRPTGHKKKPISPPQINLEKITNTIGSIAQTMPQIFDTDTFENTLTEYTNDEKKNSQLKTSEQLSQNPDSQRTSKTLESQKIDIPLLKSSSGVSTCSGCENSEKISINSFKTHQASLSSLNNCAKIKTQTGECVILDNHFLNLMKATQERMKLLEERCEYLNRTNFLLSQTLETSKIDIEVLQNNNSFLTKQLVDYERKMYADKENCSINENIDKSKVQRQLERVQQEKDQLENENKVLHSSNSAYLQLIDKLQNQYIKTQNNLRTIIMMFSDAASARNSGEASKIIQECAEMIDKPIQLINNSDILKKVTSKQPLGYCQKSPQNQSKSPYTQSKIKNEEESASKIMIEIMKNSKNGQYDEELLKEVIKRVNLFKRKNSPSLSPNTANKYVTIKQASSGRVSNHGISVNDFEAKHSPKPNKEKTPTKSPSNGKKISSKLKKSKTENGVTIGTPLRLE